MSNPFSQKPVEEPKQEVNPLEQSINAAALSAPIELEANAYGIALRITDNFNKEENFRSYTIYIVKGFDLNGKIEVTRRYSDFNALREVLLAKWPGCYIPPIPSKNLLNKMDPSFIRERRVGLDLFLQKIATIPYLYNSKEFQVFVKYSGPDFSKEIKSYSKVNYEEMVSRYATHFQHLAQIQSADEANAMIGKFNEYLKKMEIKFNTFKAVLREAIRSKKAYYHSLGQFQTLVGTEYEKHAVSEYLNGQLQDPVFFQEGEGNFMEQQTEKIKEAAKRDSIEQIYEWMVQESLDVEALIDAITQKEKLEQQKVKAEEKIKSITKGIETVAAGKFYWKTILSKKSKDMEISDMEKQILETQKDIENLILLGDMIVLILAYDEIQKFRNNKAERFYQLIHTSSTAELENLASLTDYWGSVQKGSGTKIGMGNAPNLSQFH